MVHIRRLLDIVACTTSFGGSSSPKPAGRTGFRDLGNKEPGSTETEPASENATSVPNPKAKIPDKKSGSVSPGSLKWKPPKSEIVSAEGDAAEKGDAAAAAIMCPPPRLGQFYEFFSFSHLTPPIQCEFLVYLSHSISYVLNFLFLDFLRLSLCLQVTENSVYCCHAFDFFPS